MSSKIIWLYKNNHIKNIDAFICENIQYETIMGSYAYGVATKNDSDTDLYAFTIPPKGHVFPHTQGYIKGFGEAPPNFEIFQQHHIKPNKTEYDVAVYSIVKYFSLLMDNNPNIIDSIFTNIFSTTHCTKIGAMVKDSRHIFLHKGSWYRFKGYAYSQMKKMKHKKPTGKRCESFEKYGYDVKNAYHVVRLLDEVEQILCDHDIQLTKNNRQLISIRNGDWSFEEFENYFNEKELILEKAYHESTLQKYPDESKIKQLLIDCLEEFYGSISKDEVRIVDQYETVVKDIKKMLEKY